MVNLDQLSDRSNLQLYRLLQGVDIPDFVKEAELDTEASVEALEKTAFADELNVAYPINTPARVYVSNAFFQAKKAELEERYGTKHMQTVEEKIKSAAELFSVSNEIAAYNTVHEKRANKDYEVRHVCEIVDDAFEAPVQLFPYKTASEFSKSAEVFAGNINKYPFEWRETIARSFLAKSAEVGVDELPDLVCKYAGLFYPAHPSDVANELVRRANKLSSKEAKDRLISMADVVRDSEFESLEEVMKIAHIVHFVEHQDGAYDKPKVAQLLPDPVDTFFALSPTKVAEILNVVDMGGEKYPIETLKKVSADLYKKAFGVDLDPANETELRDILPTMPLSDVSLFKELSGVTPV